MAQSHLDMLEEMRMQFGGALCGVFKIVDDSLPYKNGTPIESLVGTALLTWIAICNADMALRGHSVISRFSENTKITFEQAKAEMPDRFAATIWFQVKIGNYTADFVIGYRRYPDDDVSWIAIECDGHDFHERTKEQAAHDRARDRHFQSLGLNVFRFTGSEIWKDPVKCVDEVVRFCQRERN